MSARPDGLNDEQAKAALQLAGSLLIDAGAGSGKTRTLTQRIVYALTPGAVPRWEPASVDEVLAITFTEKAAGEIGERVRRALRRAGRPDDARRLDAAWFSTIHGLCARLLRRYALEAGLDPGFRVIDAVEAHRLKERAFGEAAAEAMSSPEGEALFAVYGFEAVSSAVDRLQTEAHSRGLDPAAIELEPARDARSLLDEARTRFAGWQLEWEACASATATADAQRDGCGRTTNSLERLDGDALAPHVLAGEVWSVLDAHPKPPSRLKGAEDLLAEMTPERERLLHEAACAATAPMAEALRRLVTDYAGRYRALKRTAGGLDFEDLQLEALLLLRRHPDVAARQRKQFRLVMVDEFQDTDRLQLELVRALAGDELCTVGDERQSIYGFRGADLGVYREHVSAMRKAGALWVPLAENYRSHADILAFVNAAFGSQALFGDGFLRLKPERDESERMPMPVDERVRCVAVARKGTSSTVAFEADVIAKRFSELSHAGLAPGSMAILLRSYKHADEYAAALRAQGLEALVVGGSRFFGRPEVQTLRSLCAAIANANDDEALGVVLASPVGGLSDDALWLVRNDPAAGQRTGTLADGLRDALPAMPPGDRAASELLGAVLERARGRIGRMPLSEVLLRAVEESAWDLRLLADGEAGKHAYANVLKFARLADAYEGGAGAGPAGFLEYLDAKEESGDHEAPATLADEGSSCVRIMSIHASKGLEFGVVALPQLGDGARGDRGPVRWRAREAGLALALALPSDRCASYGSKTNVTPWFAEFDEAAALADEEEAKRLFYVACTRAEEMLLLTGATSLDGRATPHSPLEWLLAARSEAEESGRPLPLVWERIEVTADDPEAAQPAPPDAPPERETFIPAPPAEPAPAPPLPPARLSYSDIALYRRCGLRFYAQNVLRLGSLRVEGEEEDPAAFGSAVHAALQLAVAGDPPVPGRLEAIARAFALPPSAAAKLQPAVDTFMRSSIARELEGCRRLRTEVPFALTIGTPGFLLHGTIDAYGRREDAGLIVDYKTGTSGTDAELRERFALQAACYALVALRDGCPSVQVAFVRPEVVGEDGQPQTIEYAYDVTDRERIENDLLSSHEGMRRSEYAPLAEKDRFTCAGCPAETTICPLGASRYSSQR